MLFALSSVLYRGDCINGNITGVNGKMTYLQTGLQLMSLGSDIRESASSTGAGRCLLSQVKSGCWSEPLTHIYYVIYVLKSIRIDVSDSGHIKHSKQRSVSEY